MENQKENKGVIISVFIIVLVIGVFVYILSNTKKADENLPELNSVQGQGQVTVNVTDSTTLTEGEVLPSTNTMEQISKNGDVLTMNYTGRLTNGTVFDSNVDPKFNHVEPFTFTLGAGEVIAGWDEGLVGMKVGEKKTLTIAPEKAYGSRQIGSIPANSTLIFEVELVGIK